MNYSTKEKIENLITIWIKEYDGRKTFANKWEYPAQIDYVNIRVLSELKGKIEAVRRILTLL